MIYEEPQNLLDHPVWLRDGEMVIAVGDCCLDAGRRGAESLDCARRGVGDLVASHEIERRNGKPLPILIGDHRGAHNVALLDLEASSGEDVFFDHLVDRRARCVVADTVWRVPVEVPPNVGATGDDAEEDGADKEAEGEPEHPLGREQDEPVEAFGERERVEGCYPTAVGVRDESDVVELEFIEDLIEPTHEIARMARLPSVDAAPDVVDVIERVHPMLGGERFDHRHPRKRGFRIAGQQNQRWPVGRALDPHERVTEGRADHRGLRGDRPALRARVVEGQVLLL